MNKKQNMRTEMPECAKFFDWMREAFGAEMVNEQLRRGMAGEATFYAKENGIELGSNTEPPFALNVDEYLRLGTIGKLNVETQKGKK